MPGEALERLDLPLMVTHNTETFRTAYTITVDYSIGVCCFLIDYKSSVSFSDFLMIQWMTDVFRNTLRVITISHSSRHPPV